MQHYVLNKLSPVLGETAPGVIYIWCAGCHGLHSIETSERNEWGAMWSWDGNTDAPTINPSINIIGRCHFFVRQGRIEYCGDSKHDLAGQTIDLPAIPEDLFGMYSRIQG